MLQGTSLLFLVGTVRSSGNPLHRTTQDGALVVIDVVEGVEAQTRTSLQGGCHGRQERVGVVTVQWTEGTVLGPNEKVPLQESSYLGMCWALGGEVRRGFDDLVLRNLVKLSHAVPCFMVWKTLMLLGLNSVLTYYPHTVEVDI